MTANDSKKAEVADPVPEEEGFEEVETKTAKPEQAAEPSKKNEKQSREKAKSKKQNGFVAYLKKADPIAMACFIAIILASVVVIGSYINSEYFTSESSGTATKGSVVEVDYAGSYLGYYDDAGAVIFDTSMESVGTDESLIFSANWKAKESYSPLTFTVGKTSGEGAVLTAFGDACAGHKAGDVVRVKVEPAGPFPESYGTLERIEHATMTVTLDRNGEMDLDAFNDLCGKTYTKSSFPVATVTPIEGFDFSASYDSVTEKVLYTFVTVTAGDAKLSSGAEVTVSDVTASSFSITYKAAGNAVLKGIVNDDDGNMQSVYLEHISGEDKFTYWVSDNTSNAEMEGETMYFYIKIRSIS